MKRVNKVNKLFCVILAAILAAGSCIQSIGAEVFADYPPKEDLVTQSYSNEINAMTDEDYAKFGLINSSPAEFDPNDTSNPLEGFETSILSELYVADMNRYEKWQGSFKVCEDTEELSANALNVDSMGKRLVGNQVKFTDMGYKDNKDEKEVQTHNACAIDFDGDGTDEILEQMLYVDKKESKDPKKRSKQDVWVYDLDEDKASKTYNTYQRMGEGQQVLTTDLADKNSDDAAFVWSIEADSSKAFAAMAAGDYDGDGREEGAVYVPSAANDGPYIMILDYVDGKITTWSDKIYIKEFNPPENSDDPVNSKRTFDFHYNSWKLPVVSLATTKISGQDDLVVCVSMPLRDGDDYYKHAQDSAMGIFRGKDGSMNNVYLNSKMNYEEGYRMRFASAVDTDLNGNGVGELLIGSFSNNNLKDNHGVGKLDSNSNLMQLICWSEKGGYEEVWNKYKKVKGHGGLRMDTEVMEPAALAAGSYHANNASTGVFLEGVVFYYSGAASTGETEADYFKSGEFKDEYTMALGGSHGAFISTASSACFSIAGGGTEQTIILSGDHKSTDDDQIYYDISWIWESGGRLTGAVTNDDYINSREEDDDGTFVAICPLDVDRDSIQMQYTGKSCGWSDPELYTVLQSPPYWKELQYNSESFGAGEVSYEISIGNGSGTEGEWGIEVGMFADVSIVIGGGMFGNDAMIGMGFSLKSSAKYLGSYENQHKIEDSIKISVAPGEDYAVILAAPLVVYHYDMWVPEYTVTQDMIDSYNEEREKDPDSIPEYPYKVNEVVPGHIEDYKVTTQLKPTIGHLPLEEYNELAAEYKDKGLTPIEEKDLASKTIGDPSTYPKNETQLGAPGNVENLHISKNAAVTGIGEGETELTYMFEDESEEKHGFELNYDGELYAKAVNESSFFVATDVEGEAGYQLAIDGGASWISSSTEGMGFSTVIKDLPAGSNPAYQFSSYMAVYNAAQIGTGNKDTKPYVIGYIVENADEGTVPPKLPENLRVFATTEHEVVLKWNPPDYRKAGSYEIYIEDDQGLFKNIGLVSADETYFAADNLNPSSTYKFAMKSYTGGSGTGNGSCLSRPVTAITKDSSDANPRITTQPANVIIDIKAPVVNIDSNTMAVEAECGSGMSGAALSYQWQKYSNAILTGDGIWEDIEGATDTVYELPEVTEENAGEFDEQTYYRVVVTQTKGSSVKSTISRIATMFINKDGGAHDYHNQSLDLTFKDITWEKIYQLGSEYYVRKDSPVTFRIVISNPDVTKGMVASQEDVTLLAKTSRGIENLGTKTLNNGTADILVEGLDRDNYSITAVFAGGTSGMDTYNYYLPAMSEPLRLNVGTLDETEDYYKVIYHLNGGTNADNNPHVLTNESAPVTLENPVKVGAEFTGWYQDEALTVPLQDAFIDPTALSGNLELYTGWDNTEYTITYELNGGINASQNPASYTVDTTPVKLQQPSREGYSFDGWYMSKEGDVYSEPVSGIEKGKTGDVTVYAKWNVIQYQITYYLDGGTNADANPPVYTVETQDIVLGEPQKDGVSFAGWYTDFAFEQPGNMIKTGSTGDKIFYAKWGEPEEEPPFEKDGDVYLISSAGDLQQMAKLVFQEPKTYAEASYRLTANINGQGADWSFPIGTSTAPFKGTFEGFNYYIYNYRQTGDEVNQGIFGLITASGTVQNLHTLNIQSDGHAENTGGIAAVNYGNIIKCSSGIYLPSANYVNEQGQINLQDMNSKVVASMYAGGITALNYGDIRDCSNSGMISAAAAAGGISAVNQGTIRNGYNIGRVSAGSTGIAGGITGLNEEEGSLFNLYSCGAQEGRTVGAIAGSSTNVDITKCYYNTSEYDACTDQEIDAQHKTSSEMKTESFAQTLTNNREGTDLNEWVWQNYRNNNYPKLMENNLEVRSLKNAKAGIKVTGQVHPTALLKSQMLDESDESYDVLKNAAGSQNIQRAFVLTLEHQDGMPADYDGKLDITIALAEEANSETAALIQLTDTGEVAVYENGSQEDGVFYTSADSMGTFALVNDVSAVVTPSPTPSIMAAAETKGPALTKPATSSKVSAAKTGDTSLPALWAGLLALSALICVCLTVRLIKKISGGNDEEK